LVTRTSGTNSGISSSLSSEPISNNAFSISERSSVLLITIEIAIRVPPGVVLLARAARFVEMLKLLVFCVFWGSQKLVPLYYIIIYYSITKKILISRFVRGIGLQYIFHLSLAYSEGVLGKT
jgi:hypothetical protein